MGTLLAFEAMRAGHEQVKEQQKKMNVADVDRMQDQMAELTDDMQAISESLAQSNGGDESALEEEYAKLERETALRRPPDSSSAFAAVGTPAPGFAHHAKARPGYTAQTPVRCLAT